MSTADWIALSLSGITGIAVVLQWADSNKRSSAAQLEAAEARGRAEAQFETMTMSVKALHRRWDEVGDEIRALREALIRLGHLEPIPGRTRSRPPTPPDED